MKIKSIAQICGKSKTVVLFDQMTGEYVAQWISDGRTLYPVSGLPYLDEQSIFTIFGLTEKQREGWCFKSAPIPENICVDDATRDERHIEQKDMCIIAAGRTLQPLRTSGGIVFIETRYLAPLANVMDVLEFYERKTPSGQTYIAAKAGLLLAAIIMPYEIISDGFVEKLKELTRQCEVALMAIERRTEATFRQGQFTFAGAAVDAETGEILDDEELKAERE